MSKFNPNAAVWKPPGETPNTAPAAGPNIHAPSFTPSAAATPFQPGVPAPTVSKREAIRITKAHPQPQQPLAPANNTNARGAGGNSPPVAPVSEEIPRGQTIYSSRRDAKMEMQVSHAKFLSFEDDLKDKFHLTTAGFDDQMLKLFCILHQENLLCLSSYQLFEAEGDAETNESESINNFSAVPKLILAPFWDDLNIADFHAIQEGILAAEECRMELEERGETDSGEPPELKSLLAYLEPSVPPHFLAAYTDNLLPNLLGSEAEKVALGLIVEEMFVHRHSKIQNAVLREKVDNQQSPASSVTALMYVNEASRMELSEAIGYALVLVYTVVRITNLSFKDDAARMESLRQKLYSYPGSRSFVRWCLPILVAAEVHSTNLSNLKKSYPADSLHGKACSIKSTFGKLLQKISIGFLALPPNCPVKMFYEALAPTVNKSQSVAYSIFGELYHAYPRFEEQLMTESSFNVIHLMKGSGARLPVVPPPKVLNAMQLRQEVGAALEEEGQEERAILDALRTTSTTTPVVTVPDVPPTVQDEGPQQQQQQAPTTVAPPAPTSINIGFAKPPSSSKVEVSEKPTTTSSAPTVSTQEVAPPTTATPSVQPANPGERSLVVDSPSIQQVKKSIKEGLMTSLSVITVALQSLHDCCTLRNQDLQKILQALKKTQHEDDWKHFEEVYEGNKSYSYCEQLSILYIFFEIKSNSQRRLLSKFMFMAKKRKNHIYKGPETTPSLGFGGSALLNLNGSTTTTTAGGPTTDSLSNLSAIAAAFSPSTGNGGVWGAGTSSGW